MWVLSPLSVVVVLLASLALPAYGEAVVPAGEYSGYFDGGGVYTVVGAVKNTGDGWITPEITVTVEEKDGTTHSKEFLFVPIGPASEQPFKVKFPEIGPADPVLREPQVRYEATGALMPPEIDVIYDETLILHPDGHKTGRIINSGEAAAHNIRVYALIYSEDGDLLDMGRSTEVFETVGPGQVREFAIYPDPSVAPDAEYYSCFAVGDRSIVEIKAVRGGEPYTIRYDPTAWFAHPAFSDDGRTLTMRTQNSFPLEMQANLEFPMGSDSERFQVSLDGEPIDGRQSLDEAGNWHLVFEMPRHTVGMLAISGFDTPWDGAPDGGGGGLQQQQQDAGQQQQQQQQPGPPQSETPGAGGLQQQQPGAGQGAAPDGGGSGDGDPAYYLPIILAAAAVAVAIVVVTGARAYNKRSRRR